MDWRDLIAWQQARSSVLVGPTNASNLVSLSDPGVSVNTGGMGYAVGDVVQAVGGQANVVATFVVTSLGVGSAVATVAVVDSGRYRTAPINPFATAIVGLSGATGLTLTTKPDVIPGGPFQFINQDPHRIYLLLIQATDSGRCWASPQVMTDQEQGIHLGSPVVSGDPTAEFWLDKHGLLCQLGWFGWCDTNAMNLYVLSVVQDQSPCENMPKWRRNGKQSAAARSAADNSAVSGSGDDQHSALLRSYRTGRADTVGTVAQQVLNSLRSAGGVALGGNSVPRGGAAQAAGGTLGGVPLSGYMGDLRIDRGNGGASGAPPVTSPPATAAVMPGGSASGPGWSVLVYPPTGAAHWIGPYPTEGVAAQYAAAAVATGSTTGPATYFAAAAAAPPAAATPALPPSGQSSLTLGAIQAPPTASPPAPTGAQWWFYAGLPLGAPQNLKGPFGSEAEALAARGLALTTMQGVTDVFSS